MGRRVTHIENTESGRYLLKFADRTSVATDVVVGADGIKSRCRQILFGENSAEACPKYAKEIASRGMVPMGRAVVVLGGREGQFTQSGSLPALGDVGA